MEWIDSRFGPVEEKMNVLTDFALSLYSMEDKVHNIFRDFLGRKMGKTVGSYCIAFWVHWR